MPLGVQLLQVFLTIAEFDKLIANVTENDQNNSDSAKSTTNEKSVNDDVSTQSSDVSDISVSSKRRGELSVNYLDYPIFYSSKPR